MIKKYLLLLLLFPAFLWSQGIAVSTTDYTPTQLVNGVLFGSDCMIASNITSSAACGIGYFNANASNFPFADGLVISTGQVTNIAGPFTNTNLSSVCSNQTDADLQQIVYSNGLTGSITDASFVKFHFTASTNTLSFDYIFASQEYGQYQCTPAYGDVVAFILTELTSGVSTNLATVPGTNLPVSIHSIRSNTANASCASNNEGYFDSYNVTSPTTSNINMKGQTTSMTASANLVIGASYSLKIVIGDLGDPLLDSAVFIEGGSFFPEVCAKKIEMVSFLDTNDNGIKDSGENNFNLGTFSHQINDSGNVTYSSSPKGSVVLNVDNEKLRQ